MDEDESLCHVLLSGVLSCARSTQKGSSTRSRENSRLKISREIDLGHVFCFSCTCWVSARETTAVWCDGFYIDIEPLRSVRKWNMEGSGSLFEKRCRHSFGSPFWTNERCLDNNTGTSGKIKLTLYMRWEKHADGLSSGWRFLLKEGVPPMPPPQTLSHACLPLSHCSWSFQGKLEMRMESSSTLNLATFPLICEVRRRCDEIPERQSWIDFWMIIKDTHCLKGLERFSRRLRNSLWGFPYSLIAPFWSVEKIVQVSLFHVKALKLREGQDRSCLRGIRNVSRRSWSGLWDTPNFSCGIVQNDSPIVISHSRRLKNRAVEERTKRRLKLSSGRKLSMTAANCFQESWPRPRAGIPLCVLFHLCCHVFIILGCSLRWLEANAGFRL